LAVKFVIHDREILIASSLFLSVTVGSIIVLVLKEDGLIGTRTSGFNETVCYIFPRVSSTPVRKVSVEGVDTGLHIDSFKRWEVFVQVSAASAALPVIFLLRQREKPPGQSTFFEYSLWVCIRVVDMQWYESNLPHTWCHAPPNQHSHTKFKTPAYQRCIYCLVF
jgi:hypothetical protein